MLPISVTIRSPSVTGVALAWLDLVCRRVLGTPAAQFGRPHRRAAHQVVRAQFPAVLAVVLDRRDVAVEADPELRIPR